MNVSEKKQKCLSWEKNEGWVFSQYGLEMGKWGATRQLFLNKYILYNKIKLK